MIPKREVPFRLALLLLVGCPQLLEDEFETHSAVAGGAANESNGSGGTDVGHGATGGSAGGAATATVVSTFPTDGARGVSPDVEVVFTFSASMDTRSVESAYTSSELPATQVSFTWGEDDTVLRIRPSSPLFVATGSDPTTVATASYTIDLRSQAKDKAGNALAPAHVNFTVWRSITQQLDAVRNRDLTGNWRSDDSYGSVECERADTTFCVGDGISTYKAFLTFELDGVPDDLIELSTAELSATVDRIYGDPFSALGALELEHVEFTSIGTEAYTAAPLAGPETMSTGAAAGASLRSDVLAAVQADLETRARSQFRLQFTTATNSDETADQVVCDWGSAHLTLTYTAR